MTDAVNDNDGPQTMVFVIVGRAARHKGMRGNAVHVMLRAPDDDGAVREALNSLAREGFAQVEFDQIGVIEGMPVEEPHASAYAGALEGEVAIITLD